MKKVLSTRYFGVNEMPHEGDADYFWKAYVDGQSIILVVDWAVFFSNTDSCEALCDFLKANDLQSIVLCEEIFSYEHSIKTFPGYLHQDCFEVGYTAKDRAFIADILNIQNNDKKFGRIDFNGHPAKFFRWDKKALQLPSGI